jgi:hypothetical protein
MSDPPKLFERIHETFRLKHFSPRTETSYLYQQITIRDAKGYKHRVAMLLQKLTPALQHQLTVA